MLMKRLSALFLLVVYISCLLAGCTININIGNPSEDATKETDSKNILDGTLNRENTESTLYESRASIYISNTTATEAPVISSSDLKVEKALVETYSGILQSNMIQSQIREEYPEVKYTLSLESLQETAIFAIIATGENPEYLDEICNMAATLLCENLPQIIEGRSCKIVDCAKSARLVGTN